MRLTPRQLEVATLVARGLSTKEIADATGMAPATVSSHVKQAAQRLEGPERPRHKLLLFVLQLEPPPTP